MVETSEQRKHQLITESQRFTSNLVKKMVKSMNLPVDVIPELEAAGYLGLVEAAEKFDESKGISFLNFAYLRIRGAVIDAVRQISSLSRYAYSYQKALEAIHSVREADLEAGQVSSEALSSDEMLAKVFDIAADGALAFRLSFDDYESEANDQANQELNPEDQLNQSLIKKKILEAIATLPEQQRLIIEGYYFHDKSFVEIANEEAGNSKSWVSRLHQRALISLKEALGEMDFEEFF
jgi:RNA polymerase sigma factor for flagellar operon FliA